MPKDSIVMMSEPIKLVSKKDVLISMHNDILNALTKNEIKFKALSALSQSEDIEFELKQECERSLGVIGPSISEQKLSLHFTKEALAEELDKEEKEKEARN